MRFDFIHRWSGCVGKVTNIPQLQYSGSFELTLEELEQIMNIYDVAILHFEEKPARKLRKTEQPQTSVGLYLSNKGTGFRWR